MDPQREMHVQEDEIPRANLAPRTAFNDYIILHEIGRGLYAESYMVVDRYSRRTLVLKVNVQDPTDDSYRTELRVLNAIRRRLHFPSISNNFIEGNLECIVMTYAGLSIDRMMNMRGLRHFSAENVVRLGFQIFAAVKSLHDLGFYHRDLHRGNVTARLNSVGSMIVSLIDFGQAQEINYPRPDNYENKTWFSSLALFNGSPFERVDDYIAVIYTLLYCSGEPPISNNEETWLQEKAEFHLNPLSKIRRVENRWLGILYNTIENQRGRGIDTVELMNVFYANRNCDPASRMTIDIIGNSLVIN
uniref:Protein kinase domain-containing protein n=1 Tax=Caenorhabditis tropicalis TaxID=1561998 RepID=A0A1I7V1S0_9PELO